MMATVSLRVPEEELDVFKEFARLHHKSLSEVLRDTLRDRIEEEYDRSIFEAYEKEKAAGTLKTYPHEEVWKELGL